MCPAKAGPEGHSCPTLFQGVETPCSLRNLRCRTAAAARFAAGRQFLTWDIYKDDIDGFQSLPI